jgi:hypothetical protein
MNIKKFLDWIIECDRVKKYVSIIEKKMTKLVLFKLKRGKTTYYVIYIYIYMYVCMYVCMYV